MEVRREVFDFLKTFETRLVEMADPYSVLGVTSAATPDEIRRAYYKGAKKCYSDTMHDDAAALARFFAFSEAHAQLTDAACVASAKDQNSDAAVRQYWESYFTKVFDKSLNEAFSDGIGAPTSKAASPGKVSFLLFPNFLFPKPTIPGLARYFCLRVDFLVLS